MKRVHGMTDEQIREGGMDENTRNIRRKRKVGRRLGAQILFGVCLSSTITEFHFIL
jgi:hypothetical protein